MLQRTICQWTLRKMLVSDGDDILVINPPPLFLSLLYFFYLLFFIYLDSSHLIFFPSRYVVCFSSLFFLFYFSVIFLNFFLLNLRWQTFRVLPRDWDQGSCWRWFRVVDCVLWMNLLFGCWVGECGYLYDVLIWNFDLIQFVVAENIPQMVVVSVCREYCTDLCVLRRKHSR